MFGVSMQLGQQRASSAEISVCVAPVLLDYTELFPVSVDSNKELKCLILFTSLMSPPLSG